MVGLAASQVATEVLAADGVTAMNITRWLMTQQRIADGSALRPKTEAWRLRDGDLVVVDESAMANTTDLAAIHAHCDAAGAKLLLVGDHRQLAAVGAGGGMELVTANALDPRTGRDPPLHRRVGRPGVAAAARAATSPCWPTTTSRAASSTAAHREPRSARRPTRGWPTTSTASTRC